MTEGKVEMPFGLYKALAAYFYSQGELQSALYLILTWNLACRTNNTEGIKLSHIKWQQDALRIKHSAGLTISWLDKR